MNVLRPERWRERLGRRGVSIALALAVEALLALLLLLLAPPIAPEKPRPRPTVFGIDVSGNDTPQPSEKATAKPRSGNHSAGATPPPPKAVTPPPTPDTPPPTPPLANTFIRLTRNEYAGADIAKAPSHPANDSGNGAPGDSPSGSAAGDSEVAAGKGPHGEILYAAEWYRRPTHAELSTYINRRARSSGWGLVACRTIARYHVEDCQELGESPRGSGLAGSVRQAAWQFLVRPPRIGGKVEVGAWVSIRIDYTITNDAPKNDSSSDANPPISPAD
jgi:hypothetical protein